MNTDIAQFDELGYVVIPGLANEAVCSEMITVLAGIRGADVADARGSANERVLLQHQVFRDHIVSERLIDTVEHTLDSRCHLLAFDSLDTPPGGGPFRDWHADFSERIPASICVNTGLYLQDLNNTTGPLRVVPGSHRAQSGPTNPREARLDEVALYLAAGDCVVFDAQIHHTGSANQGATHRLAVFAYYGRPWMKRMDEYYRTPLPIEITGSKAPPLLREVCGVEPILPSPHGADYCPGNVRWE